MLDAARLILTDANILIDYCSSGLEILTQGGMDSSPVELQKWLGEKLVYVGEPGLRKCLNALFGRHPIVLAVFLREGRDS